jgi:hypothetical protein
MAPDTAPDTAATERLVAVVKITGGSLQEIAHRLEDAAYDLEVKARAGCTSAEIISGSGIVTVRSEASAPVVDWRESEVRNGT